ncbi:MAG: hypothetical protein NC934_06240, partial [Candidatus Omnitrophica bacterium]|nr:hypothetical protein [Candidatus Omnitrophota bacterium]
MKKSERKESIYIRDLFLLLFVFTFLFFLCRNGLSSDTLSQFQINGSDPTGKVFHGRVTVSWSVTEETPGALYWLLYSTDGGGSWDMANVIEGLPYPQQGGSGGHKTYSIHWNTPNINNSSVKAKIQSSITGKPILNLISGPFGIYNIKPNITVVRPNGGESWSGTRTIVWDVVNPWPDDRYKIQYRPKDNYPWIDITTTETSPVTSSPVTYTYKWNTTDAEEQPATTYRI